MKAVSVNPVDLKLRANTIPKEDYRVLGFAAAGRGKAVRDGLTLFKEGNEVFYASAIDRNGINAQFHLVDERIVGHKPISLSLTEAAALPLTAITA